MKLVLMATLAASAYACQPIEGDRIFGKHLAAANPLFATLPDELDIGSSPLPGARRVLQPSEQLRIARANAIPVSTQLLPVCFEMATTPLTEERLLPVLRDALGIADATIEILDFSRYGVPRGALEFAKGGLSASGMWRGSVNYAPGRTSAIWVKTKITVTATWIEALEPIAFGKLIEAKQLVVRTGPRFPFETGAVQSVDEVAGKKAIRSLQAGTQILSAMLIAANDVDRGDRVTVEVTAGGALIQFEATAESSGHSGETIVVRHPENGHLFRALIEAKGKVSLKT